MQPLVSSFAFIRSLLCYCNVNYKLNHEIIFLNIETDANDELYLLSNNFVVLQVLMLRCNYRHLRSLWHLQRLIQQPHAFRTPSACNPLRETYNMIQNTYIYCTPWFLLTSGAITAPCIALVWGIVGILWKLSRTLLLTRPTLCPQQKEAF